MGRQAGQGPWLTFFANLPAAQLSVLLPLEEGEGEGRASDPTAQKPLPKALVHAGLALVLAEWIRVVVVGHDGDVRVHRVHVHW